MFSGNRKQDSSFYGAFARSPPTGVQKPKTSGGGSWKAVGPVGPASDSLPLFCDVCNLHFAEGKHYKVHINGLLHTQRLMEKSNQKPNEQAREPPQSAVRGGRMAPQPVPPPVSPIERPGQGRGRQRGAPQDNQGGYGRGRAADRGGRDLDRGGMGLGRGGRDTDRSGGRDTDRSGSGLGRGGGGLGGRDLDRSSSGLGRDLDRSGSGRGGLGMGRGSLGMGRGRDVDRAGLGGRGSGGYQPPDDVIVIDEPYSDRRRSSGYGASGRDSRDQDRFNDTNDDQNGYSGSGRITKAIQRESYSGGGPEPMDLESPSDPYGSPRTSNEHNKIKQRLMNQLAAEQLAAVTRRNLENESHNQRQQQQQKKQKQKQQKQQQQFANQQQHNQMMGQQGGMGGMQMGGPMGQMPPATSQMNPMGGMGMMQAPPMQQAGMGVMGAPSMMPGMMQPPPGMSVAAPMPGMMPMVQGMGMPPPVVQQPVVQQTVPQSVQAQLMALQQQLQASNAQVKKLKEDEQMNKALLYAQEKKRAEKPPEKPVFSCKLCDTKALSENILEQHYTGIKHCKMYIKTQIKMGFDDFAKRFSDLPYGFDKRHPEALEEQEPAVRLVIRSGFLQKFECKVCIKNCFNLESWKDHIFGETHVNNVLKRIMKMGYEKYFEVFGDIPGALDTSVAYQERQRNKKAKEEAEKQAAKVEADRKERAAKLEKKEHEARLEAEKMNRQSRWGGQVPQSSAAPVTSTAHAAGVTAGFDKRQLSDYELQLKQRAQDYMQKQQVVQPVNVSGVPSLLGPAPLVGQQHKPRVEYAMGAANARQQQQPTPLMEDVRHVEYRDEAQGQQNAYGGGGANARGGQGRGPAAAQQGQGQGFGAGSQQDAYGAPADTDQRGQRGGAARDRDTRSMNQPRDGRDQQRNGRDQQRDGRDQQRDGRDQQRDGRDQQRNGRDQQRDGRDQQRGGRDQQRGQARPRDALQEECERFIRDDKRPSESDGRERANYSRGDADRYREEPQRRAQEEEERYREERYRGDRDARKAEERREEERLREREEMERRERAERDNTFHREEELLHEQEQKRLAAVREEEMRSHAGLPPANVMENEVNAIMDALSPSDKDMVQHIQRMTGLNNTTEIFEALQVLSQLNPETMQLLGSVDPTMIEQLLTGSPDLLANLSTMGLESVQSLVSTLLAGDMDLSALGQVFGQLTGGAGGAPPAAAPEARPHPPPLMDDRRQRDYDSREQRSSRSSGDKRRGGRGDRYDAPKRRR